MMLPAVCTGAFALAPVAIEGITDATASKLSTVGTCLAPFTGNGFCHDGRHRVRQDVEPVVQHVLVITDVHGVGLIVYRVSQQGERLKGGVIVQHPHVQVHPEGRRGGRVQHVSHVVSSQAVASAHGIRHAALLCPAAQPQMTT